MGYRGKQRPILVGLAVLLGLAYSLLFPLSAGADPVKWFQANIPSEGKAGNWVLASGSEVKHLTRAADGTLYCYANPTGTSYTLFKSADGGRSWSPTGLVTGAIVDIALPPGDSRTVYYATPSGVYRSTDAGSTFVQLPASPGGAGSANVAITAIDVTRLGSSNIIAVATRDTDNAQYGGVYLLDEKELFSGWVNTGIGNYDVYSVAFSPSYAADRQLVAIATDETDTYLRTRAGSAAWGAALGDARLNRDNSPVPAPVAVDTSAAVVFATQPDSDTTGYPLFVAVDAGTENGDVYRIERVSAPGQSRAVDLNIGAAYGAPNVDVTGLAISLGSPQATLLAGAAASAQVYLSTDGGTTWTRGRKPPTGASQTYVLLTPDFGRNGRAYAATSGAESAFSLTSDGGNTWNQLGLIDTCVTDIVDFAPSPGYPQDGTLFLLTFGSGKHSLWRSQAEGNTWERLLTSAAPEISSLGKVALSPRYGKGSQVVFLAGASMGQPAVWRSADGGQTFGSPHPTIDPASGAPFNIESWSVADDSNLVVGSYNGTSGMVYRSTSGGFFYLPGSVLGTQVASSIALSPDGAILVGDAGGGVYFSSDNGTTFDHLPRNTSAPLSGRVTVAFNPQFPTSRTVYAASDTASRGIHRFIIGKSLAWEGIDSSLPAGAKISRLLVSPEGTLYAANSKADGGLERSLNPRYPLGPTFETVTRGLETGAILSAIWLQGHQLWAADTANVRLMAFQDTLSQPVTLTSPSEGASGLGNMIEDTIRNVMLDWKGLEGATKYQWQLSYEPSFSSLPTGFEGTTEASTARLPSLEPGTAYHWRVRATEPVQSPWSEKRSFTASLGTVAVTSWLLFPPAGATGVAIRPILQWNTIPGATGYELVVSADPKLGNPTILKMGQYALSTNAWQSNINLEYNTTYYWKVRAVGPGTSGDWSAVSSFVTLPPPLQIVSTPTPTPPPPLPLSSPTPPVPAPPIPPSTTVPDWFLYGIAPLSLLVIVLVIAVLVLALRRR